VALVVAGVWLCRKPESASGFQTDSAPAHEAV
jgi:hypothetical protein